MGNIGRFETPLVSVFYNNLVCNLAFITLAKQILHIKYGFDEATYQISKGLGLLVLNKKMFKSSA